VLVAAVLLAACATRYIPPLQSEFHDIPVPKELVYRADQSVIIESETIRSARLLYRGRMEPGSLVVTLQSGLEENGWRLVRSSYFPKEGTTQLYQKGEASLQVRIWEGGIFDAFTYLELSGSRPTQSAKAASTS